MDSDEVTYIAIITAVIIVMLLYLMFSGEGHRDN
jgi:hypothetical protein